MNGRNVPSRARGYLFDTADHLNLIAHGDSPLASELRAAHDPAAGDDYANDAIPTRSSRASSKTACGTSRSN